MYELLYGDGDIAEDVGDAVVEVRETWLGGWSNNRAELSEASRLGGRRCNFSVDGDTEYCKSCEEVGRG